MRKKDPILDLHGIQHARVPAIVEKFIHDNDLPVKIITGNSDKMKAIVYEVVEQHNLSHLIPTAHNLGEIIVF